jgi:ABC-type proline/glycine betaine transport system permease subunit
LIPLAVIRFRRRATTEQRIVLLGCIPIVLAALGIDVVIGRVQARPESF